MIIASVIIPLFNNREGLTRTLAALNNQQLSKDKFEIIVIDNGSDESSENMIKDFSETLNITYLEEHTYLNSPYSARNRGIEKAKGDIIVLLDSTCAPVQEWLEEGIKLIREQKADLVGGAIEFEVDRDSSLSALYDSIMNANMHYNIESRKSAVGGNLFIRAKLFSDLGKFPEGLRSGGDVRWSMKATASGYQLLYSEKAKVHILPKDFKTLTSKQFRVAKGHPKIWFENKVFLKNFIKKVLLGWLPPNPLWLKSRVHNSPLPYAQKKIKGLFFMGWYLRLINGIGTSVGVLKLLVRRKKSDVQLFKL